ncbi:MAG: DUF4012 domain-containing protein [Dehalococcoidia bacterium]
MRSRASRFVALAWGTPRRRTVAVLAAVLLLLGADVVVRTALSWRDARAAYADLQVVYEVVRPVSSFESEEWPGREAFLAALPAAARAADRLEHARDRLWFRGPAAAALGWLPGIGGDIEDGVTLLETGATLARSAETFLGAAGPLFEEDRPLIGALREVIVVQADDVRLAFDLMASTQEDIAALDTAAWSFLLADYREEVDDLRPVLDEAVAARETFEQAASQFDAMFGYEGRVTYVLLGQNDQEIRPTGGYIGSMGILTFEDGEIVEREYRSSMDFSPPAPPQREVPFGLLNYLGAGSWYVRDANYWPDFPTSARAVLQLLEEDTGIAADGVIALDSYLVRDLIGLFEPVTVAGYPEPITAANWFRLAEEAITGETGNPTAAEGITAVWGVAGENTIQAVDLAAEGIPTDGLPEGVVTAIRATYEDIDQLVTYSIELVPGEEFSGSFYLWVPGDWGGGPPNVGFSEFDGVAPTFVPSDPSLYGQWQRVETLTTPGGDTTGAVRVYLLEPPPPGSSLYVTSAAVTATDPEIASARALSSQAAKQAYLRPVLDTVIGQLQSAGTSQLAGLARVIRQGSAGRHFQFFDARAEVQALLERLEVDGRLAPTEGVETLAVVDANFSYSKIQPAIERDVVVLVGEDGARDVIVTWRNVLPELGEERSGRLGGEGTLFDRATTTYTPEEGVFGTYVRIYAPAGSTLLNVSGLDGPPGLFEENGLTAFGGWVVVRSGEERRAVFSYRVPEPASVLSVWKQGGIEDYGLRVLQNAGGAQSTLFDGRQSEDLAIPLDAVAPGRVR